MTSLLPRLVYNLLCNFEQTESHCYFENMMGSHFHVPAMQILVTAVTRVVFLSWFFKSIKLPVKPTSHDCVRQLFVLQYVMKACAMHAGHCKFSCAFEIEWPFHVLMASYLNMLWPIWAIFEICCVDSYQPYDGSDDPITHVLYLYGPIAGDMQVLL
jgi:hypothetical protein